METTAITVNQLITMFFFMGVGYIFSKKNLVDKSASKVLSTFLVNIFLPAMVVRTFASGFTVNVIGDKLMIILFSCAVLAVTSILSIFLARIFSKKRDTQDIYIYSFAIPNLGYMGYPLMQAIFPDSFLDTQVFCIMYYVFIYSVGFYLLTPNKKLSFKSLLNPSFLAVIVGVALGIMEIKLPTVVDKILLVADNSVTPTGMILTGCVFARINIKSIFCDWHSYATSAIRLLVIPIAALFVFRLLNVPAQWILPAVVILAMPCGVNSVVFPEAYGGDSESGAKICFMSTILSLVTIPIVFALI